MRWNWPGTRGDGATARRRHQTVRRPRGISFLRMGPPLLGAGLLATALAGCTGSTQASSSSVRSTCQQVGAVLSDGPDPSADPVGYAEAQPVQLHGISTTDRPLRTAIDELADAYQDFFDTNGSRAAQSAVDQAGKKLDSICPGVTS